MSPKLYLTFWVCMLLLAAVPLYGSAFLMWKLAQMQPCVPAPLSRSLSTVDFKATDTMWRK